jgi:hypothetical protein
MSETPIKASKEGTGKAIKEIEELAKELSLLKSKEPRPQGGALKP